MSAKKYAAVFVRRNCISTFSFSNNPCATIFFDKLFCKAVIGRPSGSGPPRENEARTEIVLEFERERARPGRTGKEPLIGSYCLIRVFFLQDPIPTNHQPPRFSQGVNGVQSG